MTTIEQALTAPPRFGGEWITPDDERYESLRWLQDRRVDRRPVAIARPAGVADVQAAVVAARERGLPLAVRSGGHGFAGNAAMEAGLQIDLRLMKDVYVDPVRRTARVRPGALNGDVVRETLQHGLVPVTGMSSEIGFGGITLFSGIGYRGPRHGKTCDNVLSVDVVLADGTLITASATSHPDLFWAIRGAGDNFGVVTSLEVALYPVPHQAHVVVPVWDVARGESVLQKLWAIEGELSEDVYWSADVMMRPDGTSVIGLPFFHVGEPGVARREIARITTLEPTREAPEARVMPYRDLFDLRLHGLDWRESRRVYFSGVHLRALDAQSVDIVVDEARKLASDRTSPLEARLRRFIAIYPFTKGFAREATPPNASNMHGGLALLAASWYVDPSQDDGHERWSDSVTHRLAAAGATTTGYNAGMLHVASKLDDDCVRRAFGDKYPRLAEIKRRYDPDNVFGNGASIVPA